MHPDEVVATIPACDERDVASAVAAAQSAFSAWSRETSAPQRGSLLVKVAELIDERAEQLAADMTREMGKPIRESRGEIVRAAAILRYFGGDAYRAMGEVFEQTQSGGHIYTLRRPLGVVGLITPWNFPAAIPIWKVSPALVYGNTVVLKAASDAPLTALRLAECFGDAGLPPGVLNVITGAGSSTGAALVREPSVAAVSFTGSVSIGRSVRDEATKAGKRVQLELGGHNPMIVLADAKLDAAVDAAYAGAFWAAGQKCTATRRIYVQTAVYDEFRRRLLQRIDAGKVGDPFDPDTEVGPVVNNEQYNEVLAAIERGRREGGTVIAGGGPGDGDGLIIEPTVFEDVRDDAYLSCEEVFGPVASLYRVDDFDEALRRANAGQYGLSAALFTQNLKAARRFAIEAQAGLLHVNSQTAGAEIHVPFGGIKSSSWGPHEQGRAALDFYTESVTLYENS